MFFVRCESHITMVHINHINSFEASQTFRVSMIHMPHKANEVYIWYLCMTLCKSQHGYMSSCLNYKSIHTYLFSPLPHDLFYFTHTCHHAVDCLQQFSLYTQCSCFLDK